MHFGDATIHYVEHATSHGNGTEANKSKAFYEKDQLASIVPYQGVDTWFFSGASEGFVLKKAQHFGFTFRYCLHVRNLDRPNSPMTAGSEAEKY